MLSVVEISNRIANPNLVVPNDLSTLQELSDKYPYTQLFSILYLKALSKAGDPRFEEELSRHSYRISDRVQLYHLIQDHEDQEVSIVSEKPVLVEEPPIIIEEKVEAPIEVKPEVEIIEEEIVVPVEIVTTPIEVEVDSPTLEETPTIEPVIEEKIIIPVESITAEIEVEEAVLEVEKEAEIEVEAGPIIEEEIEEEQPLIVKEKEQEEDISETFSEEPQDKLDESILHNVFAANYNLPDLTEEELEKLEVKTEETEPVKAEKSKETTSSNTSNFTSWLHSDTNYSVADTTDKEAINAVVDSFSEFDPSSELLFGEVEKPKTEFFSPTKKAKKSLEENELPVSETLAKIYVMQGNYPQAISAYQQLSLSFPEKKIFFANLIEDLEKKINT